jgi:hypothetical protein
MSRAQEAVTRRLAETFALTPSARAVGPARLRQLLAGTI